ncbi:helix-turn-helix domain-containing protein [Cohnella sp. AR92]|uniref:helix-turn-helix domain-containing protein n=1 Tax=Cohnella sp. AR92 TaxID=648716 RepID=UPI000F8CB699|nr:helix-turn-helix domain-containing protein [Cohnella sp. AR92]RUS47899.1 helix-turn-helix domain-containing protein [Cohnella sp. AR92]
MKKIPMMLQLVLILFFVMAIPIAILTWYSGTQILRNSESAIAESSLAGLNASRKLNENALSNLAQDAVRLGATNLFDRIRNYPTYATLNSNFNFVSSALAVNKELVNLNHRADGVYSSFFLLDEADYVVSTDKGITTLDRYEDIGWLEEALSDRRGISGVWYPRKMESGINVVSYVFPLNRLTTTTRGTIVVNIRESQIGQYLQSTEKGEQGYLLLDSSGRIISHNDKSLLLTNGSSLPYMQEVLGSSAVQGHAFHEMNGKRLLYTWSRSPLLDWWNVQVYSVDELMTKTYTLQRSIVLITVIIIFAGTALTFLLATWLSKPIRELVRTVRARGNLGVANKNELAFLDAAFRRMQDEEEGLYKLLRERERDARSLAVHRLLRGEASPQIDEIFPEPYYLVAVVSIDGYRRYARKTNSETRSYHRYQLLSQCESLFPEGVRALGAYQGEGRFGIVINCPQEEADSGFEGIKGALHSIRELSAELFGHSVTIGVSSLADTSTLASDQTAEAMEVLKHRMIEGSGGITFWRREPESGKKYIYPANSERRIVNFLDAGDLESIRKELAVIREEIQSVAYISYDNILFIYNQLVGVTIKHLRENNISTTRIFSGRGNIYSAIASVDTLDELEDCLNEFFGEIAQYMERKQGEINYGERIIGYLEEHYREDIVFENMAKEIGISYSYMRKIAYELTGKSLIDYTNLLRIEKAKELLLDTPLTISQIASEVGYFNVQSFNRFFRKFEGMPPSSYKASKTRSS